MCTIGFVGLGKMGSRMAARFLDAGHSVVVNDLSQEALSSLAARGAQVAPSPKDLADSVATVFISLPTPMAVRTVVCGDRGLIHGGRCELVVDLSTTGSEVASDVAALLAQRSKQMLDAPVSGGVVGAQSGTLAIMCSGPEPAYTDTLPLLRLLSRQTFYLGPRQGLAQIMKLINQILYFASLSTAMEALVLASKAGLDPDVVVDVVNAGSGRSWSSENRLKQAVLNGGDAGAFVGSVCKDLRLAMDEAFLHQVPMPLASHVLQQWTEALSMLDADAYIASAIQIFERRANCQMPVAQSNAIAGLRGQGGQE